MTQAEKLKQQISNNKGQAPAKQKEKQTIFTMIEKMKPEIKRALPKHIDEDRMVRLLLTTVRKNPKLQQCDPMTLLAASMQAAQLGVEPNTPMGEAYIIPYGTSAEFQLGYQGIITLAQRTGEYKSIYAHAVYANDDFRYHLGLHKDIHHVPAEEPEGDPIYYYAVYHLKNGGFDFSVMSAKQIRNHAQKFSKTYNSKSSPWQTDFNSMALKTVLKNVLKYAPKSIEVTKAMVLDETVKTEIAPDMTEIIDVEYQELNDLNNVNESPEDYFTTVSND